MHEMMVPLVSLSFSWYHGFLLFFIDIVMDLALTTSICKLRSTLLSVLSFLGSSDGSANSRR